MQKSQTLCSLRICFKFVFICNEECANRTDHSVVCTESVQCMYIFIEFSFTFDIIM